MVDVTAAPLVYQSPEEEALLEYLALLEQLERRKLIYRLEHYAPYPYQVKFHNSLGFKTVQPAVFRGLIAANQIGKTFGTCMEDAIHATGQYPDWWEGTRFDRSVDILVCGETNESVRDILQKELFGDPTDPKQLGTGTIPIDCIGKVTRKAGMQNAFDNVKVQHTDKSWSTIYFRAYEAGWSKFQGKRFDVSHLDEEPPADIFAQIQRGMFSRKQAICYLSFTPERGITALVDQFLHTETEGQAVVTAGWRDAKHMVNEDGTLTERARIMAENIKDPSVLKLRMDGIPRQGEGLVFDVSDETIRIDPIEIPKHWARINGIDFGWDHPAAAAAIAHDRDTDTVYLYGIWKESHALPAIHGQVLATWGKWVPVAWPHDGLNTEKGSGKSLIKQYRDVGVNALPDKATHAPEVGKEEGTGGNSLEASILDIIERMMTGRFKVFSTCQLFFDEKARFHRKNGQIVKVGDDAISAVRYAVMMLRHARVDLPRVTGRMETTRDGHSFLSARPSRAIR